jgi:hypothetical protein
MKDQKIQLKFPKLLGLNPKIPKASRVSHLYANEQSYIRPIPPNSVSP